MLCSVASPANSLNLEGITSRFQGLICKPRPVPADLREQVTEYIKNHRYIQYKLKKGFPDTIELQDYYLSDSRLPSQVGALTGRLRPVDYLHMEYVEVPAWAVRLRLLREGNYTLTDRGKILPILAAQVVAPPAGKPIMEANPFIISGGERFFFLYSLLEADGDILKRLYNDLLLSNAEIGVGNVRESMLNILKGLAGESVHLRGRISSPTDSETISDMIKTLERDSDQIVIPRIEPLVDCGIVARTNRQHYSYKPMQNTARFFEFLNGFASIGDFLEKGLASATYGLLGIQSTATTRRIPHYLADSYLRMRSGLGYCSIRELAILAAAKAVDEHAVCFEIDDVEQELSSLSKEYGPKVRFTKNRQGQIALVRIDRQLAERLYAVS